MSNPIEIYSRITNNKFYDLRLKPYSISDMNNCLNYYLELEEYELCSIINKIIQNRFNHEIHFKTKREE